MSVNIPQNPNAYFGTIGNHLVALREALNDLLQDAKYINAMGGAAFLQGPPFNLSPTDATNFANTIGSVTSANTTVQAIQAYLDSAVGYTGGN